MFFYTLFLNSFTEKFSFLQSYLAGMAASGALTSALRLVTVAAFENQHNGLRKGVSMLYQFYQLLEQKISFFTFSTSDLWNIYIAKVKIVDLDV